MRRGGSAADRADAESRSCQRTPRPPISSSVESAEERHGLCERGRDVRRGVHVESGPASVASSASTFHSGPIWPWCPIACRTRWMRPSGWVSVPSFSAFDSAGKTTVACSASSAETKSVKTITLPAASSAASQTARSG